MIDPRLPKYQWGQPVKALVDLYNDGSFPEVKPNEKLVAMGDRGEVVQVGSHIDSNTPIYLVEFKDQRVVGCLEEEIEPL